MGVAGSRFREGDVFIDYPFEDVLFRYESRTRRFFRKFYFDKDETEVARDNRLLNDAIRSGDETTEARYRGGKPPGLTIQ